MPLLRDLDWRLIFPGAEEAIVAAGIDPARVVDITAEEGFEVVGQSFNPYRGVQDVEVRYSRLRVQHRIPPTTIEGRDEFRPLLPSRVVETVLPWSGGSVKVSNPPT